MAKVIADIIHDADVSHPKYYRHYESTAYQHGSSSSVVNRPVSTFDPTVKKGDPVWGMNSNGRFIEGYVKSIDPDCEQGLFYEVETSDKNTTGWCAKVNKSTMVSKRASQPVDSEHWGSY